MDWCFSEPSHPLLPRLVRIFFCHSFHVDRHQLPYEISAVYDLDGVGRDGEVKHFEKPWAMTTVMFLGMTFCLPLAYYVEHLDKKRKMGSEREYLMTSEDAETHDNDNKTWMLIIPTVFDLIATILMNIGLLSVTASVYQMLRGAEMLFAALFAVVFLKRKLNRNHHMGIIYCILGIALVGSSTLLLGTKPDDTSGSGNGDILFGMLLIVLSQAVQAAQVTFEDFFMADLAIPPLKIVGYEGLFGSLMMIGIMLPMVQHLPGKEGNGIHEDSIDTWHMIMNSPMIASILVLDMFAMLAYNISGMCVTGHLGAVFRTVLETSRTLFVWLVDLILFYTPLGLGKLGESWSSSSWMQAGGFCVLVAGTVIYGKGDEEEAACEDEGYEHLRDEESLAGPPSVTTENVGIPISIGQSISSPVAVSQSSSFKASMNIYNMSSSLRNRGFHPSSHA